MKSNRVWCFLFLGILLVTWQFITIAPPDAITNTNMIVLQREMKAHKSVAEAVVRLQSSIQSDVLNDGWGQAILIDVKCTTVTLLSYGADGVPFGLEDDADIISTFSMD